MMSGSKYKKLACGCDTITPSLKAVEHTMAFTKMSAFGMWPGKVVERHPHRFKMTRTNGRHARQATNRLLLRAHENPELAWANTTSHL